MAKQDEKITKKRVTMTTFVAIGADDKGEPIFQKHQAEDFVREDFLDAYVADAQTRWQTVTVSKDYDAGPGGYHGATSVPARINHPLAGRTFPATEKG